MVAIEPRPRDPQSSTGIVHCTLCQLPTSHPLTDDRGRPFCCTACREVDALLQQEVPVTAPSSEFATAGHTDSTVLTLGGLWCASCAWLVDETLRRTPGVVDVDVSFGQQQARLVYDPERTSPSRCARQVRRLGYRAALPGERLDDEEEALFNRLLIGGIFAMHDMVLGAMIYGRELLGWATADTAWLVRIFQYMMLLGAVPLLVVLGVPIIRAGLAGLLRGRPNMHTLVALGALAAFALSVRNLVVGSDRVYFDTASMLLFLVTVGRWLEMQAQKSGRDAVTRMERRIPAQATWITPDGNRRVDAAGIPKGARVRIGRGESFPVDGVVVAGEGDVDESLLTGEATPVTRRAGERVLAGATSLDGEFEVVTTAAGSATVAGQITRTLHDALWQRAPVERLADRLSALMVPVAAGIAGLTFGFWAARSGPDAALLHALSVLLIACPCALGLATPLTLWLALARAAQAGVIVRGTAALERLAGIRQVFFDKTGTLTLQPLQVERLASAGVENETLLELVAAAEADSEHPLAQAIVVAARQRGIEPPSAADQRVWPGQGVSALVDGTTIWAGNRSLMAEHDLALPERLGAVAETWRREGMSVLYAGWNGAVRGVLGLGERARPEAAGVVRQLQQLGLGVAVLTGDDAAAGERWRCHLGIPVYAEQLPEEKLERVRHAAAPAAMVGDGINDGPALAAAAVGVALRCGTDVARTAADVVLLRDDLGAVPRLIALARESRRRVRQNLAWAFVYNLIGIGLAVAGVLQPVLAALAMVASSAMVTGNALRRMPDDRPSTGSG